MRSAQAAKDTSDLIEGAVKNADEGVALNQEVTSNFEEINNQVQKVGEVMAEIATGSDQQREGLGQITTTVSDLNQTTQQNSANAEESASAAEELSAQADELRSLVKRFKITHNSNFSVPSVVTENKPELKTVPKTEPELVTASNGHLNGNGKHDPSQVIPFDNDDLNTFEEF